MLFSLRRGCCRCKSRDESQRASMKRIVMRRSTKTSTAGPSQSGLSTIDLMSNSSACSWPKAADHSSDSNSRKPDSYCTPECSSEFHCGKSAYYRDKEHISELGIAKGVGASSYGNQTDNEPENKSTTKFCSINCCAICRQFCALTHRPQWIKCNRSDQ